MRELRRRFYLNTPLGAALCWAVSAADAVEVAMVFHTWQLETNEPWSWANPDVRIAGSNSARRPDISSPIYLSEDRIEFLLPHIKRHTRSPFFWKVSK
jgi:hypothetical protein